MSNIFSIPFRVKEGDEPLLEALQAYRRSKGWSWKYFALLGMAEVIAKDNPDLALSLVDYLTERKSD